MRWLNRSAWLKRPAPPPQGTLRLLVISDSVGATQLVSFERPLRRPLSEQRATLRMLDERALKANGQGLEQIWAEIAPTHLILSRYSGSALPALRAQARATGIPIVYHLDDDLFAVPPELGLEKFRHYNDPARLARLREAVEAADLIYASTSSLAERLKAHGIARPILAGDIYCAIDPPFTPPSAARSQTTIGYMGTSGHREDLGLVIPALETLMHRYPNVRFETFGTIEPPAALRGFGNRVAHHAATADYEAFLARLGALQWDIGLAPLVDTPFNACKANTKWVEYTAAGICVVASDLPVYRPAMAGGRGLLVADGGWLDALDRLIRAPEERGRFVQAAQALLLERYQLSHLERQLLSVLEQAKAQC